MSGRDWLLYSRNQESKSLFRSWFLITIALMSFGLHSNADASSAKPQATQSPKLGKKAKKSKASREIFSELFRVVFARKIQDKRFFTEWVDALNQGGSVEGVYNALIHSHFYRTLELTYRSSNPKALAFFTKEMIWIQNQLKTKTYFNDESAGPLPELSLEGLLRPVSQIDFNRQKKKKKNQSKDDLKQLFKKSSVYILKRQLGDELLKLLDEMKSDRKKLAKFAADLSVRLIKEHPKVYFGLELRQKKEIEFHENWALKASEDLIKWELLNRFHRIMNQFLPKE